MAANPTPTNDSVLLARCEDLIGGCQALEVELGIKQNTAATMRAAVDAARLAQAEVGRFLAERGARRAELRRVDREGEVVLGRCRLRLAALFGVGFNVQWGAAGFPDRSTMVPEVFAKRLTLLQQLNQYFQVMPAHESTDMGATAAICAAMHEALSEARSAVNQNKATLRAAVAAKGRALKKLRQRMRSLIQELDVLMTTNDPRWRRFGLNLPSRKPMPQPVASVTATPLGGGRVEVQWPAAPHATRYRVQVRGFGENDFTAAATVHDPQTLLSELPEGQFMEVRVISANAVDEAAPSPVVMVAVR